MDPAPRSSVLLIGLAIFHCLTGNENITEHKEKTLFCSYSNGNCTDDTTGPQRRGHFSKCPEEYKHYCIKGKCRYVTVALTPACVCDRGYTGARCEKVDLFYLRGDQGQIVVISLIAVMALLIILIACICICTHYCRKKRKKRKEDGMGTFEKGLPAKAEATVETDLA